MSNFFAALGSDNEEEEEEVVDLSGEEEEEEEAEEEVEKKVKKTPTREFIGIGGGGKQAKKNRKRKRREQEQQRQAQQNKLRKKESETTALMLADLPEEDEGVSGEDLEATLRVLSYFGSNLSELQEKRYRKLREVLHPIVEERASQYQPLGEKTKSLSMKAMRDMDNKFREKTALRAKRAEMLESLCEKKEGEPEPIMLTWEEASLSSSSSSSSSSSRQFGVLDGAVEITDCDSEEEEKEGDKEDPGVAFGFQEGKKKKKKGGKKGGRETPGETLLPTTCYTCKKPFTKLHFFYDSLCPECAELNFLKRNETADMKGWVCLVTGGRVKIGYRCCLKLLRCGATVICTSRFPNDTASRFVKETDFDDWKDNLHIFAADFRNISGVEELCNHISDTFPHVDVIINNACQTIRRPPTFYSHLVKAENVESREQEWLPLLSRFDNFSENSMCHQIGYDGGVGGLLGGGGGEGGKGEEEVVEEVVVGKEEVVVEEVVVEKEEPIVKGKKKRRRGKKKEKEEVVIQEVDDGVRVEEVDDEQTTSTTDNTNVVMVDEGAGGGDMGAVPMSVKMSQVALVKGDHENKELFPTGRLDVNNQQVDLRNKNSWTMKLADLSTAELAEVMAINTIAPTLINARLREAMERSPHDMRFIVNVSAMEGKFYRFKKSTHPHTNMAKAALNMMTRTSAQDYLDSKIYMTSVDTGWINDEKPLHLAVSHMKAHNFQTPLDEIDAAARVLDPVLAPLVAQEAGEKVKPFWGVFLKDFVKCEW